MTKPSKPIGSAKMTKNFQISIPKDVRKKMNVQAGDIILFFEKTGEIIIRASVELP